MSHDSQSARKDELSHDAAHTLPLLASGDDVRTGGSNRLDDLWRQEVVNRVAGFRNRRSKKILSGQFSMRLNFEAPPVIPYEPKLPIAENGVEASAADALPQRRNCRTKARRPPRQSRSTCHGPLRASRRPRIMPGYFNFRVRNSSTRNPAFSIGSHPVRGTN